MARPVTQQRSGATYGVKQRGASVALEVNAPLNVRAAPSSAENLARVLGVISEPVMQWASGKAQEQGYADATAGFADAANGNIDASRYQDRKDKPEGAVEKVKAGVQHVLGGYRKRTYTEAVDRYEAVRAFQGAANAVSEWVNTEGKLLPPGQFEVELDKRMKDELGDDFLSDPLAAGEIAKRYAPYMQSTVAAHRAENIAAQKQRNLETATTDVYGRLLQGEQVDLGFEINELANTQGDRTAAVAELVGTYQRAAIEAARTGDPETAQERGNAILAQLKASLAGDDGKPLPGPGNAKLHAASMQQAQDEVAKIHGERNKAAMAVAKFQIEADFQDQVDAGELIGMDQLIPLGERGVLSDQEMLEWYRKGADKHAARAMSRERTSYLLDTQDRSWSNLIGQEGPDGKPITKEMFEASLTEIVSAYPPEQQFAIALDWTAKTGIAYKPLAARMKNVSDTADPKDLQSLHDEYEQIKARGLSNDYLDNETAMKFERLSDLVALGLTPETMAAELRRDPKEADDYIKRYERDLRDSMNDTEVFDLMPGDDGLLNSPYVQRQLNTLAILGMRNGLSPERAAEAAKERFEQGHMTVDTPNGTMILPKVAGVSSDAMQWAYDKLLPDYASRKGLDVEQLRFVPIGPNGEMILTDANGLRVTPEVFSPTTITQSFDRMKRDSAIEQFKDTAEMERLKRTDPEQFKVMQRRAAIERANKRDADMRLYAEKRSKEVAGAFDGNLARSTWNFNIPQTAGGTKRYRNGAAKPAAAPEAAPAVPQGTAPATAEYVTQVQSHDGVQAKLDRAVNWQSNDLAAKAAPFLPHIEEASSKYGIPVKALGAQIAQESRFNPEARSGANAEGLMQIVPKWHPSMRGKTKDPAKNIDYGAKYMRDLYDQFGSWDKALAAYNTGPANLLSAMRRAQKRHGDSSQWMRYVAKETREYVAILLPAYSNS